MCEDLRLSAKRGRELKLDALMSGPIESEDDARAALDVLDFINDGRAHIVPAVLNALRNPVNPYAG